MPMNLVGVTRSTRYPDGGLRDCRLCEPNVIETPSGAFVPQYSDPNERTKDMSSVSFHPDGTVRSIALESSTDVMTPLGPIPAELIVFYPDGTVEGVFPANGRISFSWSETDEERLVAPRRFDFAFGSIVARIVGIRFYPTGEVKSLLLWPGQTVELVTPLGTYPARAGIRLHPSGSLESFEPATPILLRTRLGLVEAYDVDATTMQGDLNSVRFDEDGNLVRFSTAGEVLVAHPDGTRERISSRTRLALASDVQAKLPVVVELGDTSVTLDNGAGRSEFAYAGNRFLVIPDIDTRAFCSSSCESCSLTCA